MLVLDRKIDESFLIISGNDITRVTLLKSNRKRASIGIEAPQEIKIYREEVLSCLKKVLPPEIKGD